MEIILCRLGGGVPLLTPCLWQKGIPSAQGSSATLPSCVFNPVSYGTQVVYVCVRERDASWSQVKAQSIWITFRGQNLRMTCGTRDIPTVNTHPSSPPFLSINSLSLSFPAYVFHLEPLHSWELNTDSNYTVNTSGYQRTLKGRKSTKIRFHNKRPLTSVCFLSFLWKKENPIRMWKSSTPT